MAATAEAAIERPTLEARVQAAIATATPLRVAAVALVCALGFVGVRLAAHEFNPTSFVRIGGVFAEEAEVPDTFTVRPNDLGYDGQFYYRQARAPFSTEARVDGVSFDKAAYRDARFGYPLLVWAASLGGRESLVPWMMILVNTLAIAVLAGLAATMARDVGQSPWFGLVAAAWPGLTVALSFDLAEPVEAAFLLAAVLALRRQRWVLAAATLTFAVLTRETALVFAGALLAVSLAQVVRTPAREALMRGAVAIAPLMAYGVDQFVITRRWAGAPSGADETAGYLTMPGSEIVRQIWTWLRGHDGLDIFHLIQIGLMGLVVAIVLRAMIERGPYPWERLFVLISFVTLISLPSWDRQVVYFRYPDDFIHVGLVMALAVPTVTLPRWAKPEMMAKYVGVLWVSAAVLWAGGL